MSNEFEIRPNFFQAPKTNEIQEQYIEQNLTDSQDQHQELILDENISINYRNYIPQKKNMHSKLISQAQRDQGFVRSASMTRASINTPPKRSEPIIQIINQDDSPADESEPSQVLNLNTLQQKVIAESNSKANLNNFKENLTNKFQIWQKDFDIALKNFNSFITPDNSKRTKQENVQINIENTNSMVFQKAESEKNIFQEKNFLKTPSVVAKTNSDNLRDLKPKVANKLILNQDYTQVAVIWENQLGFSIFETQSYKLAYSQETVHEITHFQLLYRTLQFAIITKNRPNQVDFFDKGKKQYSQMFTTQVKQMSIINRHYQSFALQNQIYLYKKRELIDCIKTADNEKGLYSFATFKADDLRLILATISQQSKCSVQIKDFSFKSDFVIENVFGDSQEKQEYQIGDILIDDFGERLLVVNFQGIFLKTYSISDLRTNQPIQAIQQFRRGANPCFNFGRLQVLRIEISKNEKDVEVGVLGGESGTIHFFRLKSFTSEVQDIDTQEEESKISGFFKILKDRVLPSMLTFESSQLKIRLEKDLTQGHPYIIYPSNDPSLINVLTCTGYNLKFSIDNILTKEENQKISSQQYRTSSSLSSFNNKKLKEAPSKEQQTNQEGVMRMKFKIKDFTEYHANNQLYNQNPNFGELSGRNTFNKTIELSKFSKKRMIEKDKNQSSMEQIDNFTLAYNQHDEENDDNEAIEIFESMTLSSIGILQPDS